MSDIVERLRRWTHAVDAQPASDLMDEAAAEIERLRWRVKTLESAAMYADAMLRERSLTGQKIADCDSFCAVCPDRESTNHDAAPAARAPADSHAPRGAVDRESVGTDKAEPLTRDCGTGEISEAQIDALECVVEDGRIVGMSVYGHLRSLLVKLRPEWESDRPKPVKDDDSDRSKPISDNRLAALEQLSALDQELEERHGLQGNPMIKAQRNNEPI